MPQTTTALCGGTGPHWEDREVPTPVRGAGQVLVTVRDCGLNRADLAMLAGHFNGTTQLGTAYRAGLEMAGVVTALGEGVSRWSLGDRVMGAVPEAFATEVAVDEHLLLAVPASLTWPEAAALPVGLATEYDALIAQAGFTPGSRVLITGASSAVGLVGVQVARSQGAAQVLGTTTSSAKAAALRTAGCDTVITTTSEDLRETVLAATDGQGVDIVLDHLGGELFASLPGVTARGGTIINIGRVAGHTGQLDLDDLAFRRLRLLGTTFTGRTGQEVAELCEAMSRDLGPALDRGALRAVVGRILPLADASLAAEAMRSRAVLGKIVLAVSEDEERGRVAGGE